MVCRNRPVLKYSVPLDKPKHVPKRYSYSIAYFLNFDKWESCNKNKVKQYLDLWGPQFFFFFLITKECLKNQGPNPIAPPLSHSRWKKGIGKGTSERIRSCLIACALRIGMGLLTLSLRILNVDFPVKHEIQGESSGPVEEGLWH